MFVWTAVQVSCLQVTPRYSFPYFECVVWTAVHVSCLQVTPRYSVVVFVWTAVQVSCLQVTPRYSFPYFECVVLLGGRMGDGLSNDVKCFRADTSDFYSLRPLPFKRRNEFAACTIGDEIYVSGGLRSDEFWKYDPTFRSWLRGCSLTQPRRRHGMGAVDRSLYVLGGFDEEKVLDSIEVWRPKACSVSKATF